MREHGVLNRVLLIYGAAIRRIDAKQDRPPDAVHSSADIVRTFIEDYHEKEHALFGEEGFEKIVNRVASIERMPGTYDLAQFTPR
jgi:hypothetical protein